MAKKLRLISFWMEADQPNTSQTTNLWMKSSRSQEKSQTDLDSFLAVIKKSGVCPEGAVLHNCEVTGGNDLHLVYPWLHISTELLEIKTWLRREVEKKAESISRIPPQLMYGSLGRYRDQERQPIDSKKLIQGTYCVLEHVLPDYDIPHAGDQLCILLGFWTTNRCVDGGFSRSKQRARWRDWTGTSSLYKKLSRQKHVEVLEVEFLESHKPESGAVFQYLVLIFLQVTSNMGRISVLDTVSRFRVGNMSGYVTLYSTPK